MSTRTQVPAGAALELHAQSETTEVDGVPAILHVAIWQGNYSKGYQSDYQRVATRWLVIEVRHAQTGRLLRYPPSYPGDNTPRRRCQAFSGKRYDKATETFALIVKRDRLDTGSAGNAHRYYHQVHRGYVTEEKAPLAHAW